LSKCLCFITAAANQSLNLNLKIIKVRWILIFFNTIPVEPKNITTPTVPKLVCIFSQQLDIFKITLNI
jgi:hypothetical protein